MGRHTAADGSSRHPLVAEALAQRTAAVLAGDGDSTRESGRGWPGPPPGPGRGLGWPGDLATDESDADSDDAASRRQPPRPTARRGWRRLLGVNPAA